MRSPACNFFPFTLISTQDTDTENHHENSTLAALHAEHLGLLPSVDESGAIRAWHSSSALSHPKSGPRGVRAVPPRVGVMPMALLARMLAVGSDAAKMTPTSAPSTRPPSATASTPTSQ